MSEFLDSNYTDDKTWYFSQFQKAIWKHPKMETFDDRVPVEKGDFFAVFTSFHIFLQMS